MKISKNENLEVILKLQTAIDELDHTRVAVAWIFKWQVMDLRDKARILLEAVSRLEENEKTQAIEAAQKFLIELEPVIQELNKQKIGA